MLGEELECWVYPVGAPDGDSLDEIVEKPSGIVGLLVGEELILLARSLVGTELGWLLAADGSEVGEADRLVRGNVLGVSLGLLERAKIGGELGKADIFAVGIADKLKVGSSLRVAVG
jgi:hypothetical protein